VATYQLSHHHTQEECRIAFAAWKGYDSPLRRIPTIGSCAAGGHSLWWTVEAGDASEALAKLPPYLAERTDVVEVSEVRIP
jgi:hypothetical protein